MSQIYTLATSQSPHVAAIGAGAMGLLYGAFLSRSGCRVTMLARRPEVIEAITRGGVNIEENGAVQNFTGIAVVADLGEAPPLDLALVFVKSPDTGAAIAAVAPHLPPSASVLTLQNGLGNVDAIAGHVPREQIIAGVSYVGATLLGPNTVRLGGMGITHLGELDGGFSPRILALAQLLERSGLKTGLSDNILGLIWAKVLVNAGINPVAALTRLKNGELAAAPDGRKLISALVFEGEVLAEKLGIQLGGTGLAAEAIEVARRTGDNRASMLQDVLNWRKTEIENINGMLVEKGREIGMDMPFNRAITMLIRLLEQANSKEP